MRSAVLFPDRLRHSAAFGLTVPSLAFAAATVLMAVQLTPAAAEVLLYEPFNYTTGTTSGSGVLLPAKTAARASPPARRGARATPARPTR